MSLGADYLADSLYERQQCIDRFERMEIEARANVMHGLWQTKDGRWLHVTEMETQHINNCISMLERNNHPFKTLYVPMFKQELERRERLWE